ncbi:hypothetical protein DRQ50_04020 [bacterium]|nr:MAG: hypothetical protein DRQ50_04020 [bacterium]
MRLMHAARLPILVAWLVIGAVVGTLVSQPRLLAPYAASLVSRHLLRIETGGLRVRDYRIRTFEGVDLYGVSLTLAREDGGLTLMSADTVRVDFNLVQVLGSPARIRRLTVSRPELYARSGRDTTVQAESVGEGLGLPSLVIDELEVDNAHLEFSDAEGRLVEMVTDLYFRGAASSRDELEISIASCSADWQSRAIRFNGLEGDLLVDAEGFRTDGVTGDLNEGHAEVAGSKGWDDSLDLRVKGRRLSIAEVENLLDTTLGFSAAGDMDGRIWRAEDTLYVAGDFAGELEGYSVENLHGSAAVGPDLVDLTSLVGRFNGAHFEGSGSVSLSEPVILTLEGDVIDVDLSKGLVPGESELPVSDGHGRVRISHRAEPPLTMVTGMLRDGIIAVVPFDSCRVAVVADGDSVRFEHSELWYRNLHADLDGAADTSGYFMGNIEVTSTDLATLPAEWEWPDLQGGLDGRGQLAGPLDDLTFRGWADLTNVDIETVSATTTAAALVIDDILGEPRVRAGISGEGLRIGGVELGAYRLWGGASAQGARVDTFVAVLGDTTVALEFMATFTDSLQTYRIGRLEVGLEGTDWYLEEPVVVTTGDGVFSLPETRVVSDAGSMAVNGTYRRDAVLAGRLLLDRFDLALLDPFVRAERPMAGVMTADFILGGLPGAPVVDLTAVLVDAPFALARVDSLEISAGFGQGVLEIRHLQMVTSYGRVGVEGSISHTRTGFRDFWPGADLDLQVRVDQGDWAFMEQFALPALDRLSGRFDGNLSVAGTTASPLVRGQLHSAPFHIHWLHLDELRGEVWADESSLVLGSLTGNKDDLAMTGHLEVPLDLDFLSTPLTPESGPFYLQLDIPRDSNFEPLSRATNAFVRASGRGEASVVISGPLDHPFYQGTLALRDVGFVLRDQEEIYSNTSCTGKFRGDKLLVRDIRGQEGLRGTFSGEGELLFAGLELRTFDIRLALDRFLIASLPDLRALVRSPAARLTGVRVGPDSLLVPRFTGSMEVIRARYTGRFEEDGGGGDPLGATVAPDWLADLQLHADPRTGHIVNRDMELDLGGDLDLFRDETGFYLRGSLDVNAGRLIVFNNSFKVERGRLDFSHELGFNPRVDLDAGTQYRLRSQYSSDSYVEQIGVHVGGSLLHPEISFSSERGYSRTAIQRMLLGLEPHATPEGDAERLQAAGISAGLNVVEREFAREMAVFDTFEIDQIQRQREAGNSGLDPIVGVGKYIGPDLYLKYARGLSVEDQDIVVEYQINRHLVLQSEMRQRLDENQGQPSYNLDLKYRFEY